MLRSPKRLTVVWLLAAIFATHATEAQAAPPTRAVDPPGGDRVAGASLLAEKCTSCHALDSGGKRKWGPSLFGIVDRPMGAEAEYRYGPYLRAHNAAGDTWNEASLREWLIDSKAIAKAAGTRTKMPAQRLTGDQLDDIISYLRTLK